MTLLHSTPHGPVAGARLGLASQGIDVATSEWLARQDPMLIALIVEPLKLVGATGSTVAPIAIR